MTKSKSFLKAAIIFLLILLLPMVTFCIWDEEFQVNTYTSNNQNYPSTAMDSDGNIVITWTSYGQDGDGSGVYAQRYDNNGTPVGSEFQVNTYTTSSQMYPSAAMDSDGDFVITWFSNGQDGSQYGVYAQLYDNNGNPVGSEFLINTYTVSHQECPSAAMDPDGYFVITWLSYGQDGDSYGIYAQRFDNNGNPVGSEFQVNTYTTYSQKDPSAAMDSDGDFVITWISLGDGDYYGIYAQRYDNNGSPVGSEFQVNTYTSQNQTNPSTAMDSNGDFVITWQSNGQDGSGYGVYAQQYDNNGTPVDSEFQVNTYTANDQTHPSTAMDSDGKFVIAWASEEQDSSDWGVYAKYYPFSQSSEETPTPTLTPTQTITATATSTPTLTFTQTQTQYETETPTMTPTQTVTLSQTPTFTSTISMTPSLTESPTPTPPPNAISLESFTAKADGTDIILKWKTGTEIDNLGFYIVKSENIDEGYKLLNSEIIPAMGNAYSGHSYRYNDSNVNAGHHYNYWLVDFDIYGQYEVHGPVKAITNLEGLSLK